MKQTLAPNIPVPTDSQPSEWRSLRHPDHAISHHEAGHGICALLQRRKFYSVDIIRVDEIKQAGVLKWQEQEEPVREPDAPRHMRAPWTDAPLEPRHQEYVRIRLVNLMAGPAAMRKANSPASRFSAGAYDRRGAVQLIYNWYSPSTWQAARRILQDAIREAEALWEVRENWTMVTQLAYRLEYERSMSYDRVVALLRNSAAYQQAGLLEPPQPDADSAAA